MPELSQRLLDLQAADAETSRLARQIEQIQTTLADQMTVRAAEHAITQAQRRVQDAQRALKDLEFNLATLQAKIEKHEKDLYSGKGGTRQLQAMQQEIVHDKERRAKIEEQVLEAMEAAEAAATELARIRTRAAQVLEQREAAHERLRQEQAGLQAQLDRQTAHRIHLASTINAPSIALYDRVRQKQSDGVAVAEVVQGRCEGCRTTIPTAEVQRARITLEATQCSACGRILHVPHN